MLPMIIFYATREGQTRRIADHIADRFRKQGHHSQVMNVMQAPRPFDFGNYSAAVLAASVHLGKHEREMIDFVSAHHEQLAGIPSAFISVSLAEAGAENRRRTPEQRAEAHAAATAALEDFCKETDWRPLRSLVVAGALRYSQYNPIIRFVMKQIAKKTGAPTDTSHDYEFTDWSMLDAFTDKLMNTPKPAAFASAAQKAG